ncbi:MAG: hypothetical protein HC825_04815 [Oscillatoriales cyanobacterium RM1_1_9]|nr:hypothetical protein [Oscillatoriales cyanobacterium RM1_1_9]
MVLTDDAATVERWRATWKNRAEQLKIVALRQARQEERLKLMGDRQRAYKNWQEGWRQVLDYCGSFESLERLAPELDLQSQTFDEFHGSQAASQLWHQRWQELSQASA